MGWKTVNIQGSSFFSSIRFLEFDPSTACLNCGSIWYHPNPCKDCNERSFYRIYPLSYYLKKHHWEGLPTEEIPVISDWILRLKEGSTVSEDERKSIGTILAQISYENIKTRYLADFSQYQVIVPAPTQKRINHVDRWGVELARKLNRPYVPIFKKDGEKKYSFLELRRFDGQNVMLFDDTFTKGETKNALARMLRNQGAACVSAFVLGRYSDWGKYQERCTV